jgi:hypothetical protein
MDALGDLFRIWNMASHLLGKMQVQLARGDYVHAMFESSLTQGWHCVLLQSKAWNTVKKENT